MGWVQTWCSFFEQVGECFYGEAGTTNNTPECAFGQLAVIGNHDLGIRVFPRKYHMAAFLTDKLKTRFFKGTPTVPA